MTSGGKLVECHVTVGAELCACRQASDADSNEALRLFRLFFKIQPHAKRLQPRLARNEEDGGHGQVRSRPKREGEVGTSQNHP
eukprot:4143629-Prymnesium_polylepis.1